MKKLFSILIAGLIFFGTAICNAADSNDIAKPKPLWKTILTYNKWQDMFPAMMKVSDGFLIAGVTSRKMDEAKYEFKVVLWKIDAQGKELWAKDINLPAWQTGKPFVPERLFSLQDEPTLFITESLGPKPRKAWIIHLDNNGEVVFSKEFSPNQVFDIQGVKKTIDGLLLYGSIHIDVNNSDARVVKLNSDGNEIWRKEYDKGKREMAMGLAVREDGGFILSADSGVYNKFGGGPSEAWVIKCDPNGNILKETTFDGRHPGVITNGKITAVIFNKENFPQQDIAVIGLDENLKTIWRIESLFGKAGGLGMLSSIINKDGNFVLVGNKFNASGLWEINKEGKILREIEIEGAEFCSLFELQQIPSGYVIASNTITLSKRPLTPEGKAAKGQWDNSDILVEAINGLKQ